MCTDGAYLEKNPLWHTDESPVRFASFPPEQVIGSALGTSLGYDKNGKPIITKDPKLLLNDNFAGKPEGIHLIDRTAPGNSPGDQQMLEYTKGGDGHSIS